MLIRIKTFNPKYQIPEHSIFALSKGLNSGKPLIQPVPNCFVITAASEDDKNTIYWVLYGLWQAKAFHPYLGGSVIPFIRINDFRKILLQKAAEVLADQQNHEKTIAAIRSLEEKESQYQQNLQLIQEAKRIVLYRYLIQGRK